MVVKVVTFELKGAAELEKALKELGPRVMTNVSGRALRAMAKPIVRRAKELAPTPGALDHPYATGALKKSITTKLGRVKGTQRTIKIGYRPPVSRRAHLTEFGTVRSAAKPHMRPALNTQAQTALDEMSRVLGQGIEREAEKRGSATAAGDAEGEDEA